MRVPGSLALPLAFLETERSEESESQTCSVLAKDTNGFTAMFGWILSTALSAMGQILSSARSDMVHGIPSCLLSRRCSTSMIQVVVSAVRGFIGYVAT